MSPPILRSKMMKHILFLVFVLSSLLLPVRDEAAEGLPEVIGGRADLVVMGGKVLTVDPNFSIQQGFAIRGGRFVAVGSDQQIRLWVGPNTQVINVGGHTVIPGLNDAHINAAALGIRWARDVHWEFTRSLVDGLKQISAAAVNRPAGSWIVVDGGWTPAQFPERRFPTRAELDASAPNAAVLVRYGTQLAILNSAALAAAAITRNTAEPAGGKFERDPKGELTGVLRGSSAVEYAYKKIPEPELDTAREGLRGFFRELNRLGLTSLTDFQGPGINFAHRRLMADMARTGDLKLRITFYVSPSETANELQELRRLADEAQAVSNENFRFVGFGEIVVAGGDSPTDSSGVVVNAQTKEQLQAALRFVAASGQNFQVRAGNETTTRQVLDILEDFNREKLFGKGRIGLTAIGNVTAETIDRIKKLGAGISIETGSVLLTQDAPDASGKKDSNAPLGRIAAARIPLAAGSDAFRSGSYSPMLSLWSLITGKAVGGDQIRAPAENLSREGALRLYTFGGGWFTADDWRKGSIEVGKLADFAVLTEDYLTVPEERIPMIESTLTVIGGGVVYAAGPFIKYAK